MKTYTSRLGMVCALPGPLVGVEVGVQRGEFSAELLRCNIAQLYLVDCWRHLGGDYAKDPADIDDGGHEENYRHVVARFRNSGRVTIVRKTSVEAARLFVNGSLDFVYLDADHTYNGATADLDAWAGKIKPGGCIMGHDYVDNDKSRAMGFGVVSAVTDWCARNKWQLYAVTSEEWPSFQLVRA